MSDFLVQMISMFKRKPLNPDPSRLTQIHKEADGQRWAGGHHEQDVLSTGPGGEVQNRRKIFEASGLTGMTGL